MEIRDLKFESRIFYYLFLITESKFKKILTAESCFHLHKILDSVLSKFRYQNKLF